MAYVRPPNSIVAGVGLAQTPASDSLSPSGVSPVTLNANIATTSNLGIVQVGGNINVTPGGVISIPQDVSSNANVTFGNVTITGNVVINGNSAVSSVTPVAGAGVGISDLIANGPDVSFKVTNTGVVSLIAGADISVSSATGNITVADTSTLQSVTVRGSTTDQSINVNNATPSTSTVTGAVVINGGLGVGGNVYAGQIFDGNNRVVTSVTPTAGANGGISIDSLISTGPDASWTVVNTGVLRIIPGAGINVDVQTGNVTVSATGADIIKTITVTADYTATAEDEYIGVNSTNPVTITLPTGIVGRCYIITDEYGAGAGLITVQGTGGELINGTTAEIAIPYSSITVVFNSGMWHII